MTDIRFLHQAAHDALTKATRVLIVAHKKPDGDTLGAAAAVFNYCRSRGIAATGFCADPVPDQYGFMPGTDEFVHDPAVFRDSAHDVLAVFDAGDLRYAGVADHVAAMPKRPHILNFDHHATNERFGDVNVLDVSASSTAEVVYRFLQDRGAEIDRAIATCLLTGILTDTGNFSNPATTHGCLEAASDLLRRGAKVQEVANRLVRNKSVESLRLWGDVLSRLKYNDKLGVASTVIFAKDMERDGIDDEHVEGVANFLNNFLDVKIVLVLKETADGKVKGSFRTSEEVDVSAIAKVLGGGGHKKAAGFTVPGRIVETPQGWRVVDQK
jgi:phosphoesterase RecJ-like protein